MKTKLLINRGVKTGTFYQFLTDLSTFLILDFSDRTGLYFRAHEVSQEHWLERISLCTIMYSADSGYIVF